MSNTNTDPSNSPLPSIVLTGFSSSNSYDLHRPSYYPPAVSYLLTSLGLSKNHGAKVLDMAAGTGKFTEILAAQSEQFDIVAVEPHDEMRGVLIAKALPRTKVLGGDAQSVWTSEEWLALTRDGNWTPDAIVVAQAFHWFSTIGALRGLHKALPANGTLGLIWNVEDYNQSREYSCTTHWESLLRDLLISYEDGMPRYRDNMWPAVFDTDHAREFFSASAPGDKVIEEKIFPVTIYLTKENLWKRIGTLSYVRGLDKIEGEMQRFRLGFDEILDNDESVVRNEKGEIEMHYIVHVVWTRKRL